MAAGSDKTLFCPGIPRAGETMMAAIPHNHLWKMTMCDDIGLAYLFCSYNAQTDQSVSSPFAVLSKQLAQSRPDIAAPVTHINGRDTPGSAVCLFKSYCRAPMWTKGCTRDCCRWGGGREDEGLIWAGALERT